VRILESGTKGKRARRALVALGYLLLAFAVLSGIAQSGARFFYCEALGLMTSDPCVQAHCGGDGLDYGNSLKEKHADCCEIVTLPTTPDAARVANASVLPAALVAIVPGDWLAQLQATPMLRATRRFVDRWRAPPRSSSEVRARLMVFLT
jgi:hypothetical protein